MSAVRANITLRWVSGVHWPSVDSCSYRAFLTRRCAPLRGEENPADDGHDEIAWAANRRVELNYGGSGSYITREGNRDGSGA